QQQKRPVQRHRKRLDFIHGTVVAAKLHGDIGHAGRNNQGPQRSHGQRAQDNFRDEQGRRQRRVIGGGYTGRRTASDQQAHFIGVEGQKTANRRSDQRAQVHHRAFAPDRAAGHNSAQRRGDTQQALS